MAFSLFGLSVMETLMVLLLILTVAYIILRVAQYLLRAVVVGVLFMTIPFVLALAGRPVGTDFRTLLWFMILGVVAFFAYSSVRFGLRATKSAMSPFRKTFERRDKKKEEGKERPKKEKYAYQPP